MSQQESLKENTAHEKQKTNFARGLGGALAGLRGRAGWASRLVGRAGRLARQAGRMAGWGLG